MANIKTVPICVRGLTLGTGTPAVCVPLTGEDHDELIREAISAAASGADIAEWRADYWLKAQRSRQARTRQAGSECGTEQTDLQKEIEILKKLVKDLQQTLSSLPLLFTIRTEPEGGKIAPVPEEYNTLLMEAAASGVDMVDVEVFRQKKEDIRQLIAGLKLAGCFTVASTHDFNKTDPESVLLSRLQSMHETGADILKMAVMPKNGEDADRLLQVTDKARRIYKEPLITMSMGEIGVKTRIIGWKYGSCLTFGTTGKQSAPGQIPVGILKENISMSQN